MIMNGWNWSRPWETNPLSISLFSVFVLGGTVALLTKGLLVVVSMLLTKREVKKTPNCLVGLQFIRAEGTWRFLATTWCNGCAAGCRGRARRTRRKWRRPRHKPWATSASSSTTASSRTLRQVSETEAYFAFVDSSLAAECLFYFWKVSSVEASM